VCSLRRGKLCVFWLLPTHPEKSLKREIYVLWARAHCVCMLRQDKKFRRRLINFWVFHKSERAKCKCARSLSLSCRQQPPLLYMNHPHSHSLSLSFALHCFGLGNWIWLLSQLATLAEHTHNAADFMIGHDLNCGGAEWVDFNLYVISHSHGLWCHWTPDTLIHKLSWNLKPLDSILLYEKAYKHTMEVIASFESGKPAVQWRHHNCRLNKKEYCNTVTLYQNCLYFT
jgi:hypothetical protein